MKHLTEKQVLGPILDVLTATLPRDNLLTSASLEFFEYIKKENLKDLVKYLVANFRERLLSLNLHTFREIVLRYDQTQGYTSNMDYFLDAEEELSRKQPVNPRLMEHITVDTDQDDYWNAEEPDEDEEHQLKEAEKAASTNGSATSKLLVDYASDEEVDENLDPQASVEAQPVDGASDTVIPVSDGGLGGVPPPERLSEKRRREEDEDEDELGKLMQNKRRNSSASASSGGSPAPHGTLRRRKSFTAGSGNTTPKKIAISLSPTIRTGGPGSEEGS